MYRPGCHEDDWGKTCFVLNSVDKDYVDIDHKAVTEKILPFYGGT